MVSGFNLMGAGGLGVKDTEAKRADGQPFVQNLKILYEI
jgi:hypothetical protein